SDRDRRRGQIPMAGLIRLDFDVGVRRRQCIETLFDELLEVDGGSAGYDRRVARVQVLAGRGDSIQKLLCAAGGRVDDPRQPALYLGLGGIGGGGQGEV